jgi:electron-transferring-flavoprotein dehydrogenase
MTAAVAPLFGDDGAVTGVLTGDLGRHRDGRPKPGFAPGVAIRARQTLIAEGARGSLARTLIDRFALDKHSDPQKYGLGLKEVWHLPSDRHAEGRVDHYLGHPLGNAAAGGGFAYHAAGNQLFLGLVVHLDYADPTLSPFEEFQAFKRHPAISPLLEGATRLSYGARAIASGGWPSIPQLAFPGGALMGCAAGFMNVARLKAVHSAMRSGRLTAEHVARALQVEGGTITLDSLRDELMSSPIGKELRRVRNVKPLWSRFGPLAGAALAGLDLWITQLAGRSLLGTLHHKGPDRASFRPVVGGRSRSYPRPDGTITFSRADSVHLANIAHDDDQPVHLRLSNPDGPLGETVPRLGAEPAVHYCPAGVYEIISSGGLPSFRINAQNCIHCKTCDIKDPLDNITWTPPEGGSGPTYTGM